MKALGNLIWGNLLETIQLNKKYQSSQWLIFMMFANEDQYQQRINCRTLVLMVDINYLSQSLNSCTKQE